MPHKPVMTFRGRMTVLSTVSFEIASLASLFACDICKLSCMRQLFSLCEMTSWKDNKGLELWYWRHRLSTLTSQ